METTRVYRDSIGYIMVYYCHPPGTGNAAVDLEAGVLFVQVVDALCSSRV